MAAFLKSNIKFKIMPPITIPAPIKLIPDIVSWKKIKAHRGAKMTSNMQIRLAVKASIQEIPKARNIPPKHIGKKP